jgi:hypothetical protein
VISIRRHLYASPPRPSVLKVMGWAHRPRDRRKRSAFVPRPTRAFARCGERWLTVGFPVAANPPRSACSALSSRRVRPDVWTCRARMGKCPLVALRSAAAGAEPERTRCRAGAVPGD